jgi:hypothetical protein
MLSKYFRYFALKSRARLYDLRNSFLSRRKIFEILYKNGGWGNDETISGSGSTLKNTHKVVEILPVLFLQYHVKSMLDIPCGDFNWMKMVKMNGVQYSGADIVSDLVDRNKELYKKDFFVADIVSDTLPKVDMIFCRDCLVHLSYKDIFIALKNIKNSGARFLLTTTFPYHQNRNIVTGNWRPLNFQSTPFNFSAPLSISFEEYYEMGDQYSDKALGLWAIESIPDNFSSNE